MRVRIDTQDERPVYAQIADQMRDRIVSGGLDVGEKLPTARDLGTALGINLHTVLKAYRILEEEGLVEIGRGRGVTVIDGSGRIRQLTERLVGLAREHGMTSNDLQSMIEEKWR